MFLSMITNPDLSRGLAPWSRGIDWTYYVVVDSNVDLFLASIGYNGNGTYDARRDFIRDVARRIDLTEFDSALAPYNPRLVQQAMYPLRLKRPAQRDTACAGHGGRSRTLSEPGACSQQRRLRVGWRCS